MTYTLYRCGLDEIPSDEEFTCFDGKDGYVYSKRRLRFPKAGEPTDKTVKDWLLKAKTTINKRYIDKNQKTLYAQADAFLDSFEKLLRKEAGSDEQRI